MGTKEAEAARAQADFYRDLARRARDPARRNHAARIARMIEAGLRKHGHAVRVVPVPADVKAGAS